MPTELPPREHKSRQEEAEREREQPALDRRLPQESHRPKPARPPEDNGAFRLATIAGIPIRLHWTFFALLVIVGFASMQGVRNQAGAIAFTVSLFGCVLLHELGHALTAARYGIRTRDIVLYMFGGVASIETMPRPRQELWIALAGPAVNVVIAGVLYAYLKATGQALAIRMEGEHFLAKLYWTNLSLAAFNMLPAFPMDGGRVLRALLARGMSEDRATQIAARIGQGVAVLMGIYGVLAPSLILVFIAVMIFQAAKQEATAFHTKTLVTGHRVREAMMREFHTLPVGMTLGEAADALLAGSQQDFPIVHGGEVTGMLSRSMLMQGIATEGRSGYVAGVMEREFVRVHPEDDLETVLAQTSSLPNGPLLVMSDDTNRETALVGLLTQENLLEFLWLTQLQMRQN